MAGGSMLRVVAVAGLALVAGCGAAAGGGTGGGARVGATPPARQDVSQCRGPNVSAGTEFAERGPLSGDFVPVAALECTVVEERVPGEGVWRVAVGRRVDSGLDRFVAALREPDDAPGNGPCRLYADLEPEVWLFDGEGRAVLPRWPRDSCGHLKPPAGKLLDALPPGQITRRRLTLAVPQAVIDSGCETSWKDMVVVEASTAITRRRDGSFEALRGQQSPSVCRYRAADPGRDPAGDFVSGEHVAPARWEALIRALEASPPASPCTAHGTTFVVLGANTVAYVETDGCHRILAPDNTLRQATPRLLSLLEPA